MVVVKNFVSKVFKYYRPNYIYLAPSQNFGLISFYFAHTWHTDETNTYDILYQTKKEYTRIHTSVSFF